MCPDPSTAVVPSGIDCCRKSKECHVHSLRRTAGCTVLLKVVYTQHELLMVAFSNSARAPLLNRSQQSSPVRCSGRTVLMFSGVDVALMCHLARYVPV